MKKGNKIIAAIALIMIATTVLIGASKNPNIPEGFTKDAVNPLDGKSLITENLSDREVRDDYKKPGTSNPIYNGFINFDYKGEYYYIHCKSHVYKTDNGSLEIHNSDDDILIGKLESEKIGGA